jgi:tetratricopeptide (TPR) repeat protein
MGSLFKEKGNYKQAAFWYRKAVRQKPQDATYHIFLADNAFKFGFLKEAEKHFRNALKCSEGAIDEAYYNLGGIFLGRRNYTEAIKCYKEALKIDPQYQIAKKRLEDAQLALLMVNS